MNKLRATCVAVSVMLVCITSATSRAQRYAASDQPVAWVCSVGSRQWFQEYPCPASVMRGAPVDGFTDSGQAVHGTVDVPVPVQAQPLTHTQACVVLGDPSMHIPHRGTSDIYERGLLKHRYCGA